MNSRQLNIAQEYVRLAHALDAHIPHLIDGYSGPPEWAQQSDRSPAQLLLETTAFLGRIEEEPDQVRREWLRAQGRALYTHARLLAGEQVPFTEEVQGIYDIAPVTATTAELDAALQRFADALPGSGPLAARLDALRERVSVPNAELLRVAEPILHELRRRTRERFGLPDGENFSIHLVSDQPWSGYNWPLGNLQSRIDINTDFPVTLTGLPGLLAHEGYPGHHTENAHKETELVRARGWQEHTMQLLYSPQSVMAEGIATNALDVLMSPQEVEAWLTGELAQVAGLDAQDILAFLHATQAKEDMKHISGTAALMLWQEHTPEHEVVNFLMHYNAVSEERARQSLRFLHAHRGYIYTYSVGHERVKQHVAQRGEASFPDLLRLPLTPGQLLVGAQ